MLLDSFRKELTNHDLCFSRRGGILVVSFDFAFAEKSPKTQNDNERSPWGGDFFASCGYSILGIIVKKTDWYRSPDLHHELIKLSKAGFFKNFQRVVFVGGSMGGYGAAAFSSLHPGSIVVAMNPQSTLSHNLTPWETRFVLGRRQNWEGMFSDGAFESKTAQKVYLVYDPYHKLDALHVQRFKSPNAIRLKMPFYDHHIPVHLKRLGILKEVMKTAIETDLSTASFSKLLRNRRADSIHWQKLYNKCANKRQWHRTRKVIDYCMPRCDAESATHRYFAVRMALHAAKKGNMKIAHNLLQKIKL